MDIVTQIQEQVDKLSVALYSTLGALQRDANPVSVRGEPAEPANIKVCLHCGELDPFSKCWSILEGN